MLLIVAVVVWGACILIDLIVLIVLSSIRDLGVNFEAVLDASIESGADVDDEVVVRGGGESPLEENGSIATIIRNCIRCLAASRR